MDYIMGFIGGAHPIGPYRIPYGLGNASSTLHILSGITFVWPARSIGESL
jgi:hypothetical protein